MPPVNEFNEDENSFSTFLPSCLGAVDQEQIERTLSEKLLERERKSDLKKLDKLEQRKSAFAEKIAAFSEELESLELTERQRTRLEIKRTSAIEQHQKLVKEIADLQKLSGDLEDLEPEDDYAPLGGTVLTTLAVEKTRLEISSKPSSSHSKKGSSLPATVCATPPRRPPTSSRRSSRSQNTAVPSVSPRKGEASTRPKDTRQPLFSTMCIENGYFLTSDSELTSLSEREFDQEISAPVVDEEMEVQEKEAEYEIDVENADNDDNDDDDDVVVGAEAQDEVNELPELEMEVEPSEADGGEEEDHMKLGLKHRTNAEYAVTLDDGDEHAYQKRFRSWAEQNYEGRTGHSPPSDDEWNMEEEIYLRGSRPDHHVTEDFYIPGSINADLFRYQYVCLQWLYDLHKHKNGGIIGDEMGLGKTIQTLAFLASLKRSRKLERPVLIVCPATLMSQWVREIHDWFPPFRCVILHSTGSGFSKQPDRRRRKRIELLSKSKKTQRIMQGIIQNMVDVGHILITTYAGLQMHQKFLLPVKWGYVVLDEGHKLKNPDAAITILCKRLRTPHRLILTGTPIQNNLTELWSLFDFIYPGRLGTLPVFQTEFSAPIMLGGYANATAIEITCAYKCARALRSIIQPYMLRRMKADVAQDLPKKSEQVLFCKITRAQRELYETFLSSHEVKSIMQGGLHPLYGIDALRKISNHPSLFLPTAPSGIEASGKLVVLREMLRFWKNGEHKVLIFSQTRKMLDILEGTIVSMKYTYRRMDGLTPVKQRVAIVDEFNLKDDIFIFLLTTKVGGLGVNLTGADRVVIFDPDWNPSTDMQARERAWRLGQLRPVIIYRLIVSGTIEEKIYQRQIFKTFLSNKVLKDPKQRRFFRLNDLKDIFSIPKEDGNGGKTETLGLLDEMQKKYDDASIIAELEGVSKLEQLPANAPLYPNEGPEVSMLDKLINKGMDSSLQHDTALENVKPEYLIMEKYAEKMVESSLAALKESTARVQTYSITAPTWTGHLGLAGKPGKATGGSSSLLRKLKQPEGTTSTDGANTLAIDIRDYLLRQEGGKATSSNVLKAFRPQFVKGNANVFKKLLTELAELQRVDKVGWWVLKDQYRI